MKRSGRHLYLRAGPDPDPRYPKPKGESKQIDSQHLRTVLKRDLVKQVKVTTEVA